jgi:S1-C subfamily serine protease
VHYLLSDSPLAAAGVWCGDILTTINGTSLAGMREEQVPRLAARLGVPSRSHPDTKTIELDVVRDREKVLRVYLAEGGKLGLKCDFKPFGLHVTDLDSDSELSRAGFKVGDLIQAVNGNTTCGPIGVDQFAEIVAGVAIVGGRRLLELSIMCR